MTRIVHVPVTSCLDCPYERYTPRSITCGNTKHNVTIWTTISNARELLYKECKLPPLLKCEVCEGTGRVYNSDSRQDELCEVCGGN